MSIEVAKSMEKVKRMKPSQMKITAASSTAVKTRKADPYDACERTPSEDGKQKASRR